MPEAYFVRTASDRDVAAVSKLLGETWHATYDSLFGAEKVSEITAEWHSVAALKAKLAAPRSEFLIADDGKQISGMAFALADETGETVHLRNLYVLPAMQGRGIGGMLLDEIEDSFPEAKCFELNVESANEKAVRFYASRGYVDIGVTEIPGRPVLVQSTVRRMAISHD